MRCPPFVKIFFPASLLPFLPSHPHISDLKIQSPLPPACRCNLRLQSQKMRHKQIHFPSDTTSLPHPPMACQCYRHRGHRRSGLRRSAVAHHPPLRHPRLTACDRRLRCLRERHKHVRVYERRVPRHEPPQRKCRTTCFTCPRPFSRPLSHDMKCQISAVDHPTHCGLRLNHVLDRPFA